MNQSLTTFPYSAIMSGSYEAEKSEWFVACSAINRNHFFPFKINVSNKKSKMKETKSLWQLAEIIFLAFECQGREGSSCQAAVVLFAWW